MTDLFKYRYRVPTTRANWWNYGANGAYFITICTSKRNHYFGEIKNGKMILSETGEHTWIYWMKIPEHFPFVKLGAFIVMPNHIHGIIVIDKPKTGITSGTDGAGRGGVVETQDFASLQNVASLQTFEKQNHQPQHIINQFGPQSQNLASVIRGFKIGVTSYCKKNKILFGWQPRYHDHIIRNKGEFERIQNYILNNPINWQEDIHYSS